MKHNEKDNTTGTNHAGTRANQPLKILTASSVMGDKVYNSAGESLGKILDIMLNMEEGKIEYVVIEFGGFMGINQKYFAVPFTALEIDQKRHAFILNESKEAFQRLPGFNKVHWPETNAHPKNRTGSYGAFMGPHTGASY